jgi:hypothetical protein
MMWGNVDRGRKAGKTMEIRLRRPFWTLVAILCGLTGPLVAVESRERYLVGIGSGLAGDIGFRTEIQLINSSSTAASGSIQFFDPEGDPKAIDLQPIWIGPPGSVQVEEGGAEFQIPPGVNLILMMEPTGTGELGWARLNSSPGLGVRAELQVARFGREPARRMRQVPFEDAIEHISEVEPLPAGKRFTFPLWYWAGHRQARTAVSVVNLSGAAADVRFVFRPGSGEETIEKTVTLRPGEFLADYFDRIWNLAFPLVFPHQMRASAEVVSAGEIAAAVFNTLQELPVVAVKPFPMEVEPELVEATLGQEVELAVDQEARYAEAGLSVRFWDVPVDSRCPIDVVCVWQGEAVVAFRLSWADGREQDLRLRHEGEGSRAVLGGYRFELKGVTPAPESTRVLRVTDYRIRLLVERE